MKVPGSPVDATRGERDPVYTVACVTGTDTCKLARPERFELPTSWFVARHSIQLSYGRVVRFARRTIQGAGAPKKSMP
jgi:hypothetical protein